MDDFAALVEGGNDTWVNELVARAEAPARRMQLVDARAIATAAVTAGGAIVEADENFRRWFDARAIDTRLIARVAARTSTEGALVTDVDGALAPLACVGGSDGELWCLPDHVRAALRSRRASVAIVSIDSARADALHGDVAQAFRLSAAEARLAGALLGRGDLRAAALASQVSYETARETLAAVMRKVGVRAQTALVARLLDRALGMWRADLPNADATVAAFLGLSTRQVRIALTVTQGATRDEAARSIGVSTAVVKDELARVYATLGIDGAAQLARCMTDTLALVALIHGDIGERVPHSPGGEATRFVPRAAGGCIACTDHGPPDGLPVLLIHNTGTTRHAPRSQVASLQAAGLRPIAIDRPGYGQTDVHPDAGAAADPFALAAADMLQVCDALRLGRVCLLARGSAAVALAFAQLATARIERVVLLNPGVPVGFDSRRAGPLAVMKRALYRHPNALRLATRLLAYPSSEALTERGLRHNLAASPPDLAVLDEPDEVADYYRATRLMATGCISGYIAEHVAYGNGWVPAPVANAHHWTIVSGHFDPLHDAARSHAYWHAVMPDATQLVLADAGRFLHVSHAARIAALVAGTPPRQAPHAALPRTRPAPHRADSPGDR